MQCDVMVCSHPITVMPAVVGDSISGYNKQGCVNILTSSAESRVHTAANLPFIQWEHTKFNLIWSTIPALSFYTVTI